MAASIDSTSVHESIEHNTYDKTAGMRKVRSPQSHPASRVEVELERNEHKTTPGQRKGQIHCTAGFGCGSEPLANGI